jgi:hypothetical protein
MLDKLSKHARQNHTHYSLRFEFHCSAASAEYDSALGHVLGEDLTVVEAALTFCASEAVFMPLSAQSLNVLSNDSYTAFPALGRASLRTLCLAVDAPRVSVLLDMGHTLAKRITALGAEEVTVVPVSPESDDVLTKNRGLAVLAARREQLVPVEMAEESQTLISIFGHGLARLLFEDFASCAAVDTIKSFLSKMVGLMANFHRL